MRISEYEDFVRNSDWTGDTSSEERIRIARYGVAAEVGSLAAAIKRKILHHPAEYWATANEEIKEELGDCLWYTTQLSLIDNDGGLAEVIAADLNALPKEIESRPQFLEALAPGNYNKFLKLAADIKKKAGGATLSEYQSAAILTARTDGKELLDVCVTRLMLYATSIMSRQFPDREYHLKDDILKFTPNRTLGMLLWHVSAVANIYSLSLDVVAQENQKKIESISNLNKRPPTPLYDRVEGIPTSQQFPEKFEITYLSTSAKRLQMYYKGRPLGDELDDNSTTEDGYRFHDALHLANAAILGWSPVLRSLMGLKRKYDPSKDNAEDGARARIVEEAIVKAAHSEALRAAESEGLSIRDARKRLFSEAGQIPYPFLKLVMTYADGLEVQKSEPWEWQRAIVEGHRLYVNLLEHKQGTITVDLLERSVKFKSLVIADFRGPVVASTIEGFEDDLNSEQGLSEEAFSSVEKKAILKLLGISEQAAQLESVKISYSESGELSVKLFDQPQIRAWEKAIVGFRREWTQVGKSWLCLMMAIGAPD